MCRTFSEHFFGFHHEEHSPRENVTPARRVSRSLDKLLDIGNIVWHYWRVSGVCTAFIFERITWCPDGELAKVILFIQWKLCTMLLLMLPVFLFTELVKTTKVYASFKAGFVLKGKQDHCWKSTRYAIFKTSRNFRLTFASAVRKGWTSFLLSLGFRSGVIVATLWYLNYLV